MLRDFFNGLLVVVGDTVEVLKRVSEMLDLVEVSDAPVWIVQLHLVSYSRQAADELGVNVEPAAKAGLAFATGSLAGAVESAFLCPHRWTRCYRWRLNGMTCR